MQLDQMKFEEAYNQMQRMPDLFDHKYEVEALIKEKFKGKNDIAIDTLERLGKEFAKKNKRKKLKD